MGEGVTAGAVLRMMIDRSLIPSPPAAFPFQLGCTVTDAAG